MVKNEKMSMKDFLEIREEILQHWPTGNHPALKLEEAVKRLKSVPPHKNFAFKLRKAKADGVTLIQPRAGVARLDEHIELLKYLEEVGQADFLPSTIDSYTRHNRYENAEDVHY